MKRVILIRAGRTDWADQERLAGDMDLQINEAGRAEAATAANEIAGQSPKSVFCGTDEPAIETAAIIAASLGLKYKAIEELREMDLGLWEGLTEDQFRERFSRVHKAWHDDPNSVEPPNGEALPLVDARIEEGVHRVMKRRSVSPIVLVLGRLAYAATRCRYADGTHVHYWDYVELPASHCTLNATGDSIKPVISPSP